jgi:uncharacterized protein (TIGR00299 family) protein
VEGVRRLAWIDVSAGVAGDMLLAALLDAGAGAATVQSAVEAVIPGAVRLSQAQVRRAGLRATALRVELVAEDQPQRSWARIRSLLQEAELSGTVRRRALAAFAALAAAEARVHGVPTDDVHFHEVGAWDCLADVVGVCAALDDLQVSEIVVSEMALGSGSVRTAHGTLPVPVPAVVELCRGWPVVAGGKGELATPTGVALVTALATGRGPLPAMTVQGVGVGAGARDVAGRANVVRVVLGRSPGNDGGLEPMMLLETNVDDLDPRVWPTVIDGLLTEGAADAWLTPVVMKKGRPALVLAVLASPDASPRLRRAILDRTPALGVRQSSLTREVLARAWIEVSVAGQAVRVKVGHRDGVVVHATPEFEDVAALAASSGRAVRDVLDAAIAAAAEAGLTAGSPVPPTGRPDR